MTMDGGIVRGRVPPTRSQRRGRVHLVALPSALIAFLVAGVVIASLGIPRGDGERTAVVPPAVSPTATSLAPEPGASSPSAPSTAPSSSPLSGSPTPAPSDAPLMASPPPDLVIAPDATPIAGVIDPHQLPRFPGSEVVGIEEGIDGSVDWTLIEYTADAALDDVRQHYRTVFRETDWIVGDVDFTAGVWSFAATHDDREAQLEISEDDDDTVRVSAYVSEIDPVATVAPPTPRATRQRDRDDRRDGNRGRANRPRPAPDRDRFIPRYRGGDDDDGDDD